jgi:hypothetical protein
MVIFSTFEMSNISVAFGADNTGVRVELLGTDKRGARDSICLVLDPRP